MPHVNNIFNFKVNDVSSNGSINFGNTIHKGHTANEKRIGGQEVIGDATFANNTEKNIVPDPDFYDTSIKKNAPL